MPEVNALVQKAKAAQKKAYAPYSKFRVGAAVLTVTGKVFTGCNIENASYGLAVCAERVAIFNAVANGYRKLQAMAVVTSAASYPCGACLQVLAEFAPGLTVIISDGKSKTTILKLKRLLTKPFGWKNSPQRTRSDRVKRTPRTQRS